MMTGVQIVQAIIEIMIAGITGVATGIGAGFSELAQNIFLTTVGDATTLSVFGSLVVVFAGISLALGQRLLYMVTYIENWWKNVKAEMLMRTEVTFNSCNTCNA